MIVGRRSSCAQLAPDDRGQAVELRAAERAEEVAHAVVVADFAVLVPRHGLARLLGAPAGAVDDLGVARKHRAAARGGDDLVAVERVDGGEAGVSGGASFAGGTHGLGGVDDERHVVFGAERLQGVVVAALSVEVGGDHALGLCGSAQGAAEEREGDEARRGVGIHEHGRGAAVDGGGDGGDEGERGGDHAVAGADAQLGHEEVERGGARGDGGGVLAGQLAEAAVELVDHRPARRDVAARERAAQGRAFRLARPGRGKEDS